MLGESGLVRIDGNGERTDVELTIRQIGTPTTKKSTWNEGNALAASVVVGTWSTREGLMWRGSGRGGSALGQG